MALKLLAKKQMSILFLTTIAMVLPVYFKEPIKKNLQRIIITPEQLPTQTTDALYFLGGGTGSTLAHIARAGDFFQSNLTSKILYYKSREKWYYVPEWNRNITRNEWTLERLDNVGIKEEHVQAIIVKKGAFGTLSEARSVSNYCYKNKYKSIILVCSPCHSRRVALCFGHYLEKHSISMYIAHSDDPFWLRETLLELFKIQVYRAIIYFDKKSRK